MMLCDLNLMKIVLTKGLLFDTFFIFGANRDVVINEYLVKSCFQRNRYQNKQLTGVSTQR